MIFDSDSIHKTHQLAFKLAKILPLGSVIGLIGNLGSGKTTFTQGYAKALKINENVGSPTFKLISEYDGIPHRLYHIDAYRLNGIKDFMNIGGQIYLNPDDGITIIEWADLIKDALPLNVILLEFFRSDGQIDHRKINIKGLKIEF
tara:strand:+ start:516 stop:953 length:438 start_codon:yes stop_codon:yes gene_type:complete